MIQGMGGEKTRRRTRGPFLFGVKVTADALAPQRNVSVLCTIVCPLLATCGNPSYCAEEDRASIKRRRGEREGRRPEGVFPPEGAFSPEASGQRGLGGVELESRSVRRLAPAKGVRISIAPQAI